MPKVAFKERRGDQSEENISSSADFAWDKGRAMNLPEMGWRLLRLTD